MTLRLKLKRPKLRFRVKGGPGSGNRGHAGRPGRIGGSAPKASTFADSLIRKLGDKIGIGEITATVSSRKPVIGSYWIMDNGDIIKTRKLHDAISQQILDVVGKSSAFPTNAAAIESGIVAWHAERFSWAFRTGNRLSRLQKETINILTDMPGAKKAEFEVGMRVRNILDKRDAFRLAG
jgi:hypothetical protein